MFLGLSDTFDEYQFGNNLVVSLIIQKVIRIFDGLIRTLKGLSVFLSSELSIGLSLEKCMNIYRVITHNSITHNP